MEGFVEQRKRVLTDEDIVAITTSLIDKMPVCSLGLSREDALLIQSHLGWWRKGVNICGTIVLTAVTVFLVGIFSKGFWIQIIEGIKVKP